MFSKRIAVLAMGLLVAGAIYGQDDWNSRVNMSRPCWTMGAAVVRDTIYVIGGYHYEQ